jgi:serine O-acetyltransferase
VTIGRADLWRPASADFGGVVVEDDAIVGTGAVVLVSKGTLTLGRGSIVGANSVLTRSTGPGEIWAGNPARRIRHRDDGPRPTAEVTRSDRSLSSVV